MNVRQEIEQLSCAEEKPVLLWLFEKYHWASEWRMMAMCEFIGKTPNSRRRWHPTPTGISLYENAQLRAEVEQLKGGYTGDELCTGDAHCNCQLCLRNITIQELIEQRDNLYAEVEQLKKALFTDAKHDKLLLEENAEALREVEFLRAEVIELQRKLKWYKNSHGDV